MTTRAGTAWVARGRVRPVLVLLASDLVLLAALAPPAVARRADRPILPGESTLALPDLSFGSLHRPGTLAALAYDAWPAGVVVRVAVVLALHALLAVQVARRATPARAYADVRLAVLAASPLLGALAGLTLVVPSAFAFGATVEDREVIREVALGSFLSGATWGLVAGVVGALALTLARRLAAPPPPDPGESAGDAAGDDDTETWRMVRAAVAAGPAAAGTALVVVALLGGRALAPGPYEVVPTEARRLLGYVHWALQPTGLAGYQRADYVPLFALLLYLFVLLVVGAAAGALMVRRPPLLRVAAGWWAVLAALLAYAGFGAMLRTVVLMQTDPDGLGGSVARIAATTVNDVVAALPALAAYTALVGWIPAVAAAAAVGRTLRREPATTGSEPQPAAAGE